MRRDATLGRDFVHLGVSCYDERSLQYNNIGHESATALANAVASNESLQTLDLRNNKISDEGATALANALAKKDSLQTLDRALYEKSLTPLMQACKEGKVLTVKDLVADGARVDVRDIFGQTPLFHACKASDTDDALLLVKFLFKHSAGKPALHPRLLGVFAEQLLRKNPVASFADFDRQQAILREKAQELTALQEAVKADSEKISIRDEIRRDLVAGIRDALSGGIEGQLKEVLADPGTKAAVDACHSLLKEILKEPVDFDDLVAPATFEQVQEATQAAMEAVKVWETRHDASVARKHTEAAIDALDESTKRLGFQTTSFMTLRHPEKTKDIARELKEVQEAFEEELRTLTEVDPLIDAPLEEVRRALAITISFYTSSTVKDEVSRLQTAARDLLRSLSRHVPGLTAPDTPRVTEMIKNIRQSKRKREDLELKLRRTREDANDGDATAQAKIPGLEQELAQIGSVYKLDSELRKERARVLRHAEEHYPELLCDQDWIRSLGMKANVPRELSMLGLWLTNAKRGDFETLAKLASKPGKSVHRVRDLNGREYVLKSFHLADEEWSSRFYRQVSALAQFRSAYIVRVQGVFMQDAREGCILMPYYEGGDLAAWIHNNPRADLARRRRIAVCLLSGLHDLHAQGFVHCDVKPENVFLAKGLSPVLGDFDGVQTHNVTMTQPMQATIRYMAPELRNRNVDKVEPAVDMFSVGVMLADLFRETEVSDATTTLISSLQSTDPTQRPTALEALRHEAFQIEPVKDASCALCFDIYPVSEGVSCADNHFTCRECLSRSVRAATEPQSHVKVLRHGSMCCVTQDCDLVIPGRCIAAAVPDEDFAALLDIVRQHIERDVAAEQERQLQLRLDAAIREHGLNPTAQNHILRIQNDVLNMSCPRCSKVFADFDDCCALECGNDKCKCYFCAWCLQDTGDDSQACHQHVARCASKPDDEEDPFFSDFAVVQQAWARLRAQRLREYVAKKIEDPGMRADVQNMLRPLLTSDIVGDNFTFS
ncbi:Protein kinase, putative [Hondaea fermentalgiana]|uniref:Protein kinase, putative n=1 Tax=Hondaea fermentalgiana TaxID=2315210 RepID=A0A2R5GUU4_9STRA|nr:Protein kinase, putative [Hondaea fermentalgiana]|eukprot:GBG34335.1 Protein kinase, putative [Hondaea fermentalgiana]